MRIKKNQMGGTIFQQEAIGKAIKEAPKLINDIKNYYNKTTFGNVIAPTQKELESIDGDIVLPTKILGLDFGIRGGITALKDGSKIRGDVGESRNPFDSAPVFNGMNDKIRGHLQANSTVLEGKKKNKRGLHIPYLDSGGIPTIGYGTTRYPTSKKVTMKDKPINDTKAKEYFDYGFIDPVKSLKNSKRRMFDHQAAELLDYGYNAGSGSLNSFMKENKDFNDTSKVVRSFLESRTTANGKPSSGLLKRRAIEASRFYGNNVDDRIDPIINEITRKNKKYNKNIAMEYKSER